MPLSLPNFTTGQLVTAAHLNNITNAVNTRLQSADLLGLTAFGMHTLNAAGTGTQGLTVRNTAVGASNLSRVDVGNDAGNLLSLIQLSSTFPSFSYLATGGAVVYADGPGGMNFAATHPTDGLFRYYMGTSSVERMRLNWNGSLIISGAAAMALSAFQSGAGLVVNQGTNSDEIISLKAEDVAHGITTIADTNTYGALYKASSTDGGLRIRGLSESVIGLDLKGNGTTEDTTSTTTSNAAVTVNAAKKSGTGLAAYGTTANLLCIRNEGGGTRWMVKGNGDVFRDGTDNVYEAHDDAKLALAWEHSMSPSQRVADLFNRFCGEAYGTDRLIELGILAPPDPQTGRHFYNESALLRLCAGAVWQLGLQVQGLKDRLETARG